MPRIFEPWVSSSGSWVRFHRWSNRFRPGLKIRFTVAFLSGRHFEQFISASRSVRLSLSYSTFISFPVYSCTRGRPNVKTRCFRVATRRISHVSIAQRFTVLSASFPRDFYTTGTTTPRPSFPSIRPIHPLLARFFLSRILRKSSREICARARRLRLPAYWFEMFQDLADIFFFV